MEIRVINRHYCRWLYFTWKAVINRVEDNCCCRLYFSMESHVINRIRDGYIFPRKVTINRIRRYILSLAIFFHGKSCNKSY